MNGGRKSSRKVAQWHRLSSVFLLAWWANVLVCMKGGEAFVTPPVARKSALPMWKHRTFVSLLHSKENSKVQDTTEADKEGNEGDDDTGKEKKTPRRKQQEQAPEQYIEIQYEGYFDGTKPDASWNLARNNFLRQGRTLFDQLLIFLGLLQEDPLRPPTCLKVTLSNEDVMEAERKRVAAGDGVEAHPVSRLLYDAGCLVLDRLFDGRPIQRFWFLETIARIPYFSYVSMLHLYESLGWWRAVELRKVHAAEEWNELHHLLILESLGGNSVWSDRFLGYHVAIAYYWFLIIVFLGSPRIAYQFMELLEAHAVDTYGTFCRENRQRLSELPPPSVAKSYYLEGDLYMFDDFQVSRPPASRRPPCDTLLDVFQNICQDEAEHVKTMKACQEYALTGERVVSPHLKYKRTKDMEEKRKLWQEWSEQVNAEDADAVVQSQLPFLKKKKKDDDDKDESSSSKKTSPPPEEMSTWDW